MLLRLVPLKRTVDIYLYICTLYVYVYTYTDGFALVHGDMCHMSGQESHMCVDIFAYFLVYVLV